MDGDSPGAGEKILVSAEPIITQPRSAEELAKAAAQHGQRIFDAYLDGMRLFAWAVQNMSEADLPRTMQIHKRVWDLYKPEEKVAYAFHDYSGMSDLAKQRMFGIVAAKEPGIEAPALSSASN